MIRDERVMWALLLRLMLAVGIVLALVLGWQVARGPKLMPNIPSVRVARLPPGSFMVVDDPTKPRGLTLVLKLMVLRDRAGHIRAFYLPTDHGRPSVPVSGIEVKGVPCEDFAPDFEAEDIGCRQARPSFEFVTRYRWDLHGKSLARHLPDLFVVQGHEAQGDWLLDTQQRP